MHNMNDFIQTNVFYHIRKTKNKQEKKKR